MDSFACLKTENILFTRELFVSGYLCVFLFTCSASISVVSSLLFRISGFSFWSDPGDVLSSFPLDVTSNVGSGMPVITFVTSIVSVISISSATTCSDTSVSSVGFTKMACEIPVFPVGSASFVISLGTASSVAVSDFSLCSYLGSASPKISDFSLGTASFVAIFEFSLCSYLGSSISVTFESSVVCVALGASTTSVTTGSIFSGVLTSVLGSETSVTYVSSFSSFVSFIQ